MAVGGGLDSVEVEEEVEDRGFHVRLYGIDPREQPLARAQHRE